MIQPVGVVPADPELSSRPERPFADAPALALSCGLAQAERRSGWKRIETALWTGSAACVLIVLLAGADRAIFSARESRLLDERLAGGSSGAPSAAISEVPAPASSTHAAARGGVAGLAPQLPFVAKLDIPTIALTALVVDGVDAKTLSRAVGRIPSSSLPGEAGDVALAGHRDTDFRAIGKLERGDALILRTAYGEFRYEVESIRIVPPQRVDVLAPTDHPTLTLVTCYPFRYVGPAPLRYVVRAREVARPSRLTI